jgi:hypothetical protein
MRRFWPAIVEFWRLNENPRSRKLDAAGANANE